LVAVDEFREELEVGDEIIVIHSGTTGADNLK